MTSQEKLLKHLSEKNKESYPKPVDYEALANTPPSGLVAYLLDIIKDQEEEISSLGDLVDELSRQTIERPTSPTIGSGLRVESNGITSSNFGFKNSRPWNPDLAS